MRNFIRASRMPALRFLLCSFTVAVGVRFEAVAATVVNLTETTFLSTASASSGSIGIATFTFTEFDSTGSGVIDSFLVIQANGTEKGYNTDTSNVLDNKSGTEAIQISDLRVSGANVRFLLDITESSGGDDGFLSLDQLKIVVAANPPDTGTQSGATPTGSTVYDMDAGDAGNIVLLDAFRASNSGSGKGDVFIEIPKSAFDSYGENDYVYLYAEFGGGGSNPGLNAGFGSSSSFEEFAIILGDTPLIPEPSTYLAGLGMFGILGWSLRGQLGAMLRRRKP
jgi:hypothetical protein